MNYTLEYIQQIESNKIRVNWKIRKWYCEFIKPILLGKSKKYYFNETKGERVINFVEECCIQSKGVWNGKFVKLELFQKAKWQAIFGILNRKTHLRRFKEVFDVRGRKNGKTTELAAIALYLLREEKGAEVYAAAATLKQAKRLWGEAKSMVKKNPKLSANKKPSRGKIGEGVFDWKTFPESEIFIEDRDARLVALATNLEALDGLNSSAAIIDEVHVLGRDIYDLLKQSMSTRKQPLLSMISTAGFLREGLYDDIYDYAINVLNGIAEDDTFFPLIYDLDDSTDLYNEEMWICANPALDVIKSREDLRNLIKRMETDRKLANTVKVKDFNIRGVDNKAWLGFDIFNSDVKFDLKYFEKFKNCLVIGGFDLSRTKDMTAFTTLLFDRDINKIIALTDYFITQDFYDSEITTNSKIPWKQWIDQGLVHISGTNAINYHDISNLVRRNFTDRGWMYYQIGYDSYSATYLVDELASYGYAKGTCLIPVIQGFKSLSQPMQKLEEDLKNKKIVYQNNSVTKWCFSNVELVEDRNGNYMPKKNSDNQKRKIDGVATILNCYYVLLNNYQTFMS